MTLLGTSVQERFHSAHFCQHFSHRDQNVIFSEIAAIKLKGKLL